MNLRWRNRLLVTFVIFAVLPAGLVAYLAFDTFQSTSRKASLSSLKGLVRAKAAAIDEFTVSSMLDVQRLSAMLAIPVGKLKAAQKEADVVPTESMPAEPLPQLDDGGQVPDEDEAPAVVPVAEASDAVPPPPEKAASDNVAELLRAKAHAEVKRTLGLLLGEQATFEELLVIALDGRVVASTFSGHEGKTAAEVEYFKRGRAVTYVQPVFQSPITGDLTMVIATPIRSANNEELGVLAARLNLKQFFRLINDNTGLGVSGETLVGRIIDHDVVLMAPTRSNPDAALRERISIDNRELPLVSAARGESAARQIRDRNHKNVLAAWAFVPSLEWGIVTKIDVDEASEPVIAIQKRLLFMTLAVMGLAILASFLFARALVKPVLDLKNAAEKISRGDLDVELSIKPGDELGDLADSFERMIAAIKFFRDPGSDELDESEDLDLDLDLPPPSTEA